MKCSIAKELLPNYMDGLTSEETNADMRKHLEGCDSCRTIYEQLSSDLPKEIPPEEKNIAPFKKFKANILRRNVIVAISTFLVLGGFYLFARYYRMPLPFDPNRMFVEPVQAVVELTETPFGNEFMLSTLDYLDFETSKEVLSGEREVLDLVQFAYRGINDVSYPSRGRTLIRDGEEVRVVYFCYYKTLWKSMFFGDFIGYSESGSTFGDIYDYEVYKDGTYEPQMREIYYLPIQNIHEYSELENLSDEEFDALREEAYLIWSGVN